MMHQKSLTEQRLPVHTIMPFLSALAVGPVVAVMGIMLQISLASLIFAGNLSPFLGAGIGIFLAGTFALAVVGSLASSFRSTIVYGQEMPAVLLAPAAGAVMAALPAAADPAAGFYTVVAMLAISALLSGGLFLVLGRLGLGNLVRYLPHPVVGGFLAGTGLLLALGGIAVMTELPATVASLPFILQPALLVRWLPGLLLGGVTLLLLRRHSHFLIVPSTVCVAIVLFYCALAAQGISIESARAHGWLLGPFPTSSLWTPLSTASLANVHWSALLEHSGIIGTALLLSLVALLLNVSGLELVAGRNLDLNEELRTAGLANLASGLVGGPIGFHYLSTSKLVHNATPNNRLVGLVFALITGLVLLKGALVLSLVPTFVAGGLLLILGFSFLAEWLYDGWWRLSRIDYGIVLLIALTMGVVGVLQGVALGILLTVLLFVIESSRIDAISQILSGKTYHSTVDRSLAQRQFLRARGNDIYILQLQGLLFFGTAHRLFEHVRNRLEDGACPPPRFVVLDFRQVHKLDASAALSINRMVQVAQDHGVALLLSHLSDAMWHKIDGDGFDKPKRGERRRFADLDHAVEWCEEQLLSAIHPMNAANSMQHAPGDDTTLGALHIDTTIPPRYLERFEVEAGHVLIHQGEESQGCYLIETGRATVEPAMADGEVCRLRTMQPGAIVGELGLYTGAVASASVITLEPSTIYFLSSERLAQMSEEAPQAALALHLRIVRTTSTRLLDATDAVRALL